ncbi:MAG: GIY-YIG nuclease family protein [Hyphomicrobiales bacterium]|nr:MAG: GIY-YIG nuclease family protein [Hyphomicrobiales bacterium]
MGRTYFVYILASGFNGTLYVGVTNNLVRRVYEHRSHEVKGFTKDYDVTMLVWYEVHEHIDFAIAREKQIKRWKRDWKLALFEDINPRWEDLYPALSAQSPFG